MRKLLCIILATLCILLASCGNNSSESTKGESPMYEQITAEEAKKIMDSSDDYTILDVREQDEYDAGHIPGAMLLPYTGIENEVEELLTDKDEQLFIYCRSGRRSKIAAEALVELGYTNVKEFGGIIDWPYEVEK